MKNAMWLNTKLTNKSEQAQGFVFSSLEQQEQESMGMEAMS